LQDYQVLLTTHDERFFSSSVRDLQTAVGASSGFQLEFTEVQDVSRPAGRERDRGPEEERDREGQAIVRQSMEEGGQEVRRIRATPFHKRALKSLRERCLITGDLSEAVTELGAGSRDKVRMSPAYEGLKRAD